MRKFIFGASFMILLSSVGISSAYGQTFSASGIQGVDGASGQALASSLEALSRQVNNFITGTVPVIEQQLQEQITDNASAITTANTQLADLDTRLGDVETRLSAVEGQLGTLNTTVNQMNTAVTQILTTMQNTQTATTFVPSIRLASRTVDGDVFAKGIVLSCNPDEVVTGCHNHCSRGGDDTHAYPTDSRTCRGVEPDGTHKGTCTLVAACMKINNSN